MIVELQAKSYETEKKGDVKRMRRRGVYPAVLYGHKEKSRRICIEQSAFKKVLEILKEEAVTINLKVDTKGYLCVIKSIQHNPITGELLHIDFQHIHKKEKIKTSVPIHLVGEAPGIKSDGILEQNLHEVVVKCLPADMPSHIEVDISALDLGHTIHLYDVELPNIEFELSKETSIVTMTVPRAVVVEEKPEAEVPEEEKEEVEAKEEGEEKEEKKGSKEQKPEQPAKKG